MTSEPDASRVDRHQPAALQALHEAIAAAPTVRRRMTFGHPCFATGGKLFACAMERGIALKLPRERIAELEGPGIVPFAPRGHPMGGWIEIRRHSAEEYQRDVDLIDEALAYVTAIAAGAPRDSQKSIE